MNDNPLLVQLMKDKLGDVVHSSAYAQAQNADRIGADSSQSFTARREIDQNRQNIKVYKDSEVIAEVGKGLAKAAKFDTQKEASQIAAIKEKFGDRRERQFQSTNNEKVSGNLKGSLEGGSTQVTPPARRTPGISW